MKKEILNRKVADKSYMIKCLHMGPNKKTLDEWECFPNDYQDAISMFDKKVKTIDYVELIEIIEYDNDDEEFNSIKKIDNLK